MEEASTSTCKPITCTRAGSKTTTLSKEDAFNQTVLILKATSKMSSKKPKVPYILKMGQGMKELSTKTSISRGNTFPKIK